MQVNALRLAPNVNSQAFNGTRFGNNVVNKNSSPSTDQLDPIFGQELSKIEKTLNYFDNAVRRGTIQFISAKETLQEWARINQRPTVPILRFKLNNQTYDLTLQAPTLKTKVSYTIKTVQASPKEPQRNFKFIHHLPDPQRNYSRIEMSSCHGDGPQNWIYWSQGGYYHPSLNDKTPSPSLYLRPGMIETAEDLGKLLLLKLGDSMREQGITSPLLPDPPKQLEHNA